MTGDSSGQPDVRTTSANAFMSTLWSASGDDHAAALRRDYYFLLRFGQALAAVVAVICIYGAAHVLMSAYAHTAADLSSKIEADIRDAQRNRPRICPPLTGDDAHVIGWTDYLLSIRALLDRDTCTEYYARLMQSPHVNPLTVLVTLTSNAVFGSVPIAMTFFGRGLNAMTKSLSLQSYFFILPVLIGVPVAVVGTLYLLITLCGCRIPSFTSSPSRHERYLLEAANTRVHALQSALDERDARINALTNKLFAQQTLLIEAAELPTLSARAMPLLLHSRSPSEYETRKKLSTIKQIAPANSESDSDDEKVVIHRDEHADDSKDRVTVETTAVSVAESVAAIEQSSSAAISPRRNDDDSFRLSRHQMSVGCESPRRDGRERSLLGHASQRRYKRSEAQTNVPCADPGTQQQRSSGAAVVCGVESLDL